MDTSLPPPFFLFLEKKPQPDIGIVAHICNPSIWEAEVEGSQV
jgi:hypothetical protein